MTENENKAMARGAAGLFRDFISKLQHQFLIYLAMLVFLVSIILIFFSYKEPGIDPTIGYLSFIVVVVFSALLGFYRLHTECNEVREERDNLKDERDMITEVMRNMADKLQRQRRESE